MMDDYLPGRRKPVNRHALDELKQQISLLEYLQAHDWQHAKPIGFIRFAELYHQVKVPQALELLHEAAGFYRMQLHRHAEAVACLYHRGVRSPELIEHMRIAYAPGGCLRGWLTQLGYSRPPATTHICTASSFLWKATCMVVVYWRRRRPTHFCPAPKGGLYWWEQAQPYPGLILVESLFDYAVLWQAGFRKRNLLAGNQPQCSPVSPTVRRPSHRLLSFDADSNGSGQQAAQCLADMLRAQGLSTRCVLLPDGHDPNSFFVQGGDARRFQSFLEASQP